MAGAEARLCREGKNYRLSEDDAYALLHYEALFHDQETVEGALQRMRDYAGQGYSLNMNNLGWTYLFGTGVTPQRDVAIAWYRKDAALGNVISQYQLGCVYSSARRAARAIRRPSTTWASRSRTAKA